jgi:hypothetical protein
VEFKYYESMDEMGVKMIFWGKHGGDLVNYKHD